MRLLLATSAACLAMLGAATWAQPPSGDITAEDEASAEAALPTEVCLTNACGGTAVDLTGENRPRTVAEAISFGNGRAVRDLGGTPAQAMDALLRRAQARAATVPADQDYSRGLLINYLTGFMDPSGGHSLAFDTQTDPGSPETVGSIVRSGPDGESRIFLNEDGGGTITVNFTVPPQGVRD